MFTRALEISPKFAAAWMNLAIVEANLGQHKSAESSYLRAISLRRIYPDAHFNLGTLYLKLGLKEKALEEFTSAIDQNPAHFSAWSNKVILLDELGRYAEGLEAGQRALSVFAERPDFYFHLANIYGKSEQFEQAEAHYLQAISMRPVPALYHLNLGVLYHRWKKYPLAIRSYEKALSIDPNNQSAKANLMTLRGE